MSVQFKRVIIKANIAISGLLILLKRYEMKKRKYVGVLVSAFIGVLAIVGVYWNYKMVPSNENQVKIGATYMTMNNDFYKVLNNEVEKIVEENNDILYTRDPALDVDKQTQQVESFIEKGVNIIIINPVDANSQKLIKALKKAKRAGIKIVVVDSQLSDDSSVDTTIVSDNYQAGVLCAQNLMQTQSSAKILLLEHQNAVSAVDRINGFLDTIKNNKNYKILASADTQGQIERALPKVDKIIEEYQNIDIVMGLNDPAAMGALAALDSKGAREGVLVYGIDGSPEGKKLIKEGMMTGTAAQSPKQMADTAVNAAYQILQGEKVEKKKVISVQMITKKNVEQTDISRWQ